jgi:hypothetical protein
MGHIPQGGVGFARHCCAAKARRERGTPLLPSLKSTPAERDKAVLSFVRMAPTAHYSEYAFAGEGG